MNLETMSPAEIDTLLAEIYARIDSAKFKIATLGEHLQEAELRLDPSRRFFREADVEMYQRRIVKLEIALTEATLELRCIRNEAKPMEAEFAARGGWTRAFMVRNTNGHVHSTMNCSTCFPTTIFGWMPEWSGRNQEEIIDAAASSACTICFPDAPVDKPSIMELADVKAAREEREAAKAERDAKKAAKTIEATRVTDYVLRDGTPQMFTISTMAAARAWLTDHFCSMVESEMAAHYKGKPVVEVETIADLVAAKEGKIRSEVYAEAFTRAVKRAKREKWSMV